MLGAVINVGLHCGSSVRIDLYALGIFGKMRCRVTDQYYRRFLRLVLSSLHYNEKVYELESIQIMRWLFGSTRNGPGIK